MTELGRKNPISAHQQTVLRANFAIGRFQSIEQMRSYLEQDFGFRGVVKLIGSTPSCPFCSEADGKLMNMEEAPVFPPPECVCTAPYYLFVPEIDFLSQWNEPEKVVPQSLFGRIRSWLIKKS